MRILTKGFFLLKYFSFTILLSICYLATQAQSYEVGLAGGASNYHGDLAYNIQLHESKASAGAFYRYNFNEHWAMRPMLSYLQITGADSNFQDYTLRNLSFRNRMVEVSQIFEYNFQPFSQSHIHENTTFYTLLGISVVKHEPEAYLNGEWHKLRTVTTENQPYKLLQVTVPFGAGIKHALTKNWIVGIEVNWRRTFTDYLDDVSTIYPDLNELRDTKGELAAQLADRSWEVSEDGMPRSSAGETRGDPNLTDWYFNGMITFSYRFTPIKCPF